MTNLQTYVQLAGGKRTISISIYFQHCTNLRRHATLLMELVARHVVGVARFHRPFIHGSSVEPIIKPSLSTLVR